jgi:hypothetical protein
MSRLAPDRKDESLRSVSLARIHHAFRVAPQLKFSVHTRLIAENK